MQRMSDELLKWLFGVNEVLKMSIATEHSDVPARVFLVAHVKVHVLIQTIFHT